MTQADADAAGSMATHPFWQEGLDGAGEATPHTPLLPCGGQSAGRCWGLKLQDVLKCPVMYMDVCYGQWLSFWAALLPGRAC